MRALKDGALEGLNPEAYIDPEVWEDAGQGWWYATTLYSFVIEIFRLFYPKTYHRIEHMIKDIGDRVWAQPASEHECRYAFGHYLSGRPWALLDDLRQGKFADMDLKKG